MKINLAGWESEGLRCPDIKIDLMVGDNPAKVALVQMPNGTGKTTSLQMLTATLNGSAADWSPTAIRELRRPDDPRTKGRFRVDLRIEGKPLTFELVLDFEEGQVSYRTTMPATGGVTPKWEPPPGVRRFFSPAFIQLFVFDGEFADRLLKENDDAAERAIDALCQLYLLDDLSEFSRSEWTKAVDTGGGGTTSAAKTLAQNRLQRIQKQKRKIIEMRAKAAHELSVADSRLAELIEAIKKHIAGKSGIREEHENALAAKTAAQSALDAKLGEVMQQMRQPNALNVIFGEALLSLKQNLDRLKLPEATSRQFFVELSEEELCVCGRALDEHTRAEIIQRSKLYLGEDEAGSINALKKDIETYCVAANGASAFQRLDSTSQEMLDAMTAVSLADQKVRTLKQSLIDSGDDALARLETERNQVSGRIDDLRDLLLAIDQEPTGKEDAETTECLKAVEQAEKEAETKLATISNTLRHKAETDLICQIAAAAKSVARDDIRASLKDECNDLLLNVLGNDPLQIASIGRSLTLMSQRGASVGQTLSVGYTFLMSLLNRGSNSFPLIVDSPCGSLGGGRREAIGELIPRLCDQFVTFVIDKERDDFLPALEKNCNGSIKYFTAFRNSPQTERLRQGLPATGVTSNSSAIVVENRDFFVAFKE